MKGGDRERLTRWMARLADGERAAFAPVYATLWPVLQGFCRRSLGHDADGDDAAQEALLKIFARATEFDPRRDAVSWAFGIAAWQCRTVHRRSQRRREAPMPANDEWVDERRLAEEEVLLRDLIGAATEILGTLRPGDERTIQAAFAGDRAGRDGVAPATFRKRLERALGRLRDAWRSRHGVS